MNKFLYIWGLLLSIALSANASKRADISFFIADLKYCDEKTPTGFRSNGCQEARKRLTILEFGDGKRSGFKVLDHLCEMGIVWKKVWHYLDQFNLPIFIVGDKPVLAEKKEAMAGDLFTQMGGIYTYGLQHLEHHPLFKTLANASHNPRQHVLKNYKGIIVFRSLPLIKTAYMQQKVRLFKRHYPQFLYMDETDHYVTNKHLTDCLFNTETLKSYRPRCNFYAKIYTPTLADQIIKDLGAQWFVLKPIKGSQGRGILMVHEKDLDTTLAVLFSKHNDRKALKGMSADYRALYDYWRQDTDPIFLVEEYVQSKDVWFEAKPYDPTMRIAFIMDYNEGKINFTWLHAYWKRPLKALTDETDFREMHISKHAPNAEQSLGWEVDPIDEENIKKMFIPMMEKVYKNMLHDLNQHH